MAASITELIFRFSGDSGNLKSTMAQVRAELSQTSRSQTTINKGELSMRQQLSAAASLQRQRSAALIAEWKKGEAGGKSFKDVVDGLSRSIATMQGPLGGVAGRFSSIGSLFTELTSSGAGLAAGIGAIAAIAAGASVAIFRLTQQAAEFQGKMFDLSQQVGVSVETLSTLEVFATTSGASIEALTQSIFIFQQHIQDAQDPTSKQAKLFKELGITSNETEKAFRQALTALAGMTDASKQANAAAELFGSRGGKQMLGTLKEMDGDVDGATAKLNKMGILITTDVAKAADKFNDQLAILGFQIRALAGIIGNEAMPEISAAIQRVSQLVTENQGVIRGWTSEIGDAARGALILADAIREIGGVVTGLNNIPIPLIIQMLGSVSGATGILRGLAALGKQPEIGGSASIGTGRGVGIRRPTGGGGGGRRTRDTALADATKEAALAEREALLITAADITENKRAFEEGVRTIEDFTRRAIELNEDQLNATIDRITAESNALDTALAKRSIKRSDYEIKQRELDLQAAKAHQENRDFGFEQEQERDRKISEARIAAKNRELQIADDADQRQVKRIEDRVDQEVLLESEAEQQIAEITAEAFERRRKALEEELDAYSTTLERRAAITDELIKLEGERAGAAEEASRRIRNALQQEAREQKEALEKLRERTKDIERDSAGTAIDLLILNFARRREVVRAEFKLRESDEELRHKQEWDSIAKQRAENKASARTQEQKNERTIELNRLEKAEAERHRAEMDRIRAEGKKAEALTGPGGGFATGLDTGQLVQLREGVQSFADVATVAFSAVGAAVNQLSLGIGNLVQQWVLLGATGPAAFRKLVASVLAGVAAQAATLAVMELAYGIAALTPWGAAIYGPAPFHFKAAALFGSIALVSGLAGRAVAGSTFNNAGAGGDSRTGGGTSERREPSPIDLVRNQQPTTLHIFVHTEPGAQFGNQVVRGVIDNIRINGPMRGAVKEIVEG